MFLQSMIRKIFFGLALGLPLQVKAAPQTSFLTLNNNGIDVIDNSNFLTSDDSATSPLEKTNDETYYDSVSKWFNVGRSISFDTIDNQYQVWVGRCFIKTNPNVALNSMILTYRETKDQAGPGFPISTTEYSVISGYQDENLRFLPANKLDLMSYKELTSNIQSVLKSAIQKHQLFPSSSTDGSYSHEFDIEGNGNIDGVESLRQYGKYIVAEMSNILPKNKVADRSIGKMVEVAQGPYAYCYYFKQIKP